MRKSLLLIVLLTVAILMPKLLLAQGAAPLLDEPLDGCYDAIVVGVGLYNDSPPIGIENSVTVPAPPGPIVAAYIEWVGAEDTTPGGATLDGTSTLLINGVDVPGILAAPFDLSGNAGFDPRAHTSAGPRGWFSWHAEIGPDGLGIVPATLTAPMELIISGWDSPAQQTNGATISLIYETGACAVENQIRFLTGVNWYHYHAGVHHFSELLVYPVEPAPIDRVVSMVFSHAGTDKSQTTCRGGAVWMVADDGTRPMPGQGDFDLLATGDNDGDGIERGYGINGGVEILNDPFSSSALPCTPGINLVPDEPYANGHPYPGGASVAPYRAVSIDPGSGGDVGAPGEWGVLTAQILIPANARWVAFQLESEPDQNGESGSWVGGGVFLVVPTATVGDRVWHDANGNGLQDNGETGIGGAAVQLLDSNRNIIGNTTTGGNGIYSFADLATGDYAFRFLTPDGFIATPANVEVGPDGDAGDSDADPTSGETELTNLLPSEADFTWDAGFYQPASIGDFVWIDTNRDGIQNDGDTGVNGVQIDLFGAGPDGSFGSADDLTYRTVTSSAGSRDGDYTFSNLPPGRYYAMLATPRGYVFTQQSTGTDRALDSDVDPASAETAVFELLSGAHRTDIDAGLVQSVSAIAVEKTPDLQRIEYGATATFQIRVTNPGELDLSDVMVEDPETAACDRLIGDLPVGGEFTYVCSAQNVLVDFTNTATATGIDPLNNAVSAKDDALVDVLPAITASKTADPLAVPRSGGEVTFSVSIVNTIDEMLTLSTLIDDIHGPLDGQGTCTLPQSIAPGEAYTCSFTVTVFPGESGETDTITGTAYDDDGNMAEATATATVLPRPGQGKVGDYVWYDINSNGLQDGAETGVPDVRVEIFTADDKPAGVTRTDTRGAYLLTGLEDGDFYLVFTADMLSNPFSNFSPQRDGAPLRDSDVVTSTIKNNPLSGRTDLFTLLVDGVDMSRDAGLVIPTVITEDEPTAIELLSFTTKPAATGIAIEWVTGAELDTAGFHIYRSTTHNRADAVPITNALIPGQGADGGSYRVIDDAVLPGIYYHYWLIEIETDGDRNEHGPIRGRIQPAATEIVVIYLPTIANR